MEHLAIANRVSDMEHYVFCQILEISAIFSLTRSGSLVGLVATKLHACYLLGGAG